MDIIGISPRFLSKLFNEIKLCSPGSLTPFCVTIVANLRVSLVVEIVLPSDVFYFDIHTFLLRCQKQMVPEIKSKFHCRLKLWHDYRINKDALNPSQKCLPGQNLHQLLRRVSVVQQWDKDTQVDQ